MSAIDRWLHDRFDAVRDHEEILAALARKALPAAEPAGGGPPTDEDIHDGTPGRTSPIRTA